MRGILQLFVFGVTREKVSHEIKSVCEWKSNWDGKDDDLRWSLQASAFSKQSKNSRVFNALKVFEECSYVSSCDYQMELSSGDEIIISFNNLV